MVEYVSAAGVVVVAAAAAAAAAAFLFSLNHLWIKSRGHASK